jgi:hypothetical protein
METAEAFDSVPLHGLPPMEHKTTACWLQFSADATRALLGDGGSSSCATTSGGGQIPLDLGSGLHGANHALKVACCVLLECNAADVCCEHAGRELRLLLYDTAPGGTCVLLWPL